MSLLQQAQQQAATDAVDRANKRATEAEKKIAVMAFEIKKAFDLDPVHLDRIEGYRSFFFRDGYRDKITLHNFERFQVDDAIIWFMEGGGSQMYLERICVRCSKPCVGNPISSWRSFGIVGALAKVMVPTTCATCKSEQQACSTCHRSFD